MSSAAPFAPLGAVDLYPEFALFVQTALARQGVRSANVDALSQEVFLLLHRQDRHFETRGHARAWLYAAARRVASRHRRSRARDPNALVLVPTPTLDAHMERAEVERAVEQCANGIAPEVNDVFLLSDLQGCSGPAVAAHLGIPLHTADSQIRRVRARLKGVALVFGAVLLAVIATLASSSA